MMKTLIISSSDSGGGAAIAAKRLLKAVRREGVDATMAVQHRLSDNSDVFVVGSGLRNRYSFYSERAEIFLYNRCSKQNLFDISTSSRGISITSLPQFKEADVIHLHWINQGMLSLNEIEKIVGSGKKIVWTMHDMWPFTGICHHAAGCTLYERGCGECKYLKHPHTKDLSDSIFRKKLKSYSNGEITFVACSRWLRDLAKKSPLTNNHWIISIPNPIDTKTYHPLKRNKIRERMNLPKDKKIALFVAVKASDPRKGRDYMIKASELLTERGERDLLFLIVGTDGESVAANLAVPALAVGYVAPEKMIEFYSAADLYVTPSLQENLPNSIMEAMACGTPVVGFRVGGIPEMIEHRETGYLANERDVQDFAYGIEWVLNNTYREQLRDNSRAKVLKNYRESKVAKQYIELYNS